MVPFPSSIATKCDSLCLFGHQTHTLCPYQPFLMVSLYAGSASLLFCNTSAKEPNVREQWYTSSSVIVFILLKGAVDTLTFIYRSINVV